MSQTVDKIILFTLAACPTGRNMGTILREVGEKYPSIKLKTVYVEIDIEMTNHYRIKTNPTLLFLNREDKELFRLEGFHETEEINDIIREINQNKRSSTQTREPNKGTTENYTIFLLKSGKPTAVKVQHYNETSIKAPRITIINILLNADINGYENRSQYRQHKTNGNFIA